MPWQKVKSGLHDRMEFFLDTTMLLGYQINLHRAQWEPVYILTVIQCLPIQSKMLTELNGPVQSPLQNPPTLVDKYLKNLTICTFTSQISNLPIEDFYQMTSLLLSSHFKLSHPACSWEKTDWIDKGNSMRNLTIRIVTLSLIHLVLPQVLWRGK